MKVLLYCQHVLGMGHFFRTLETARAFAGHEVLLLTGGAPVEAELPAHVRLAALPELSMDENFSALGAPDGRDVEAVKAERAALVLEHFRAFAPDCLLVELFPFGRNAFRFELVPLLDAAREAGALIACAVRDILVEKPGKQAAFEERAVERMNRWFDLLLIQADPRVVELPETFSRLGDIRARTRYVGYVAERPRPDRATVRAAMRKKLGLSENDRLIVVSAGGGKVGGPLMTAVAGAWPLVLRRIVGPQSIGASSEGRPFLRMVTGPYLDPAEFAGLADTVRGLESVALERFRPDFLELLTASDMSISMAGYNTCMNLLASGTRAMAWPFGQNREQRMRLERLAARGLVSILDDADLAPGSSERLADRILHGLDAPPPPESAIDLDGAAATVRAIEHALADKLGGKRSGVRA